MKTRICCAFVFFVIQPFSDHLVFEVLEVDPNLIHPKGQREFYKQRGVSNNHMQRQGLNNKPLLKEKDNLAYPDSILRAPGTLL